MENYFVRNYNPNEERICDDCIFFRLGFRQAYLGLGKCTKQNNDVFATDWACEYFKHKME